MNLIRTPVLCVAVWLTISCVGGHAGPFKVDVDFNSNALFYDSAGRQRFALPASQLSAQQKAEIITKAQSKFDDILGAGQVELRAGGTGGDMKMIVSGTGDSQAYGNMGRPGQPGVVWVSSFIGNPAFAMPEKLACAIGETLAHEIAHKLGVPHNPGASPSELMAEKVPPSIRALDQRYFTSRDREIMLKNLPNSSNDPRRRENLVPGAFYYLPNKPEGPGSYMPNMLGDDPIYDEMGWDASLDYQGPANSQFGYISTSGQFVYQADAGAPDQFMTFFYSLPYDFAIRLDNGTIIALSDGAQSFELLDPNPHVTDATVYQTLIQSFDTPQGPATATLRLVDPSFGGGWILVPEPTAGALLLAGLTAVGLRRKPRQNDSRRAF
jgi:hypothetical protein